MSDARVQVTSLFAAFAVPAIVTRPNTGPIETEGIWISPLTEDLPGGFDLKRATPRRVLALRIDEVPTVPHGTVIVAPEELGGIDRTWRVDGFERVEHDLIRAVVVPAPEET